MHIVYILAYRIHPSGKYLTLAIKPNVNHKKDGQGVVSNFRNSVQPCLYCMIQLGEGLDGGGLKISKQ